MAIVLVMQRVHEDDLTAHLLAKDENWVHLNLPASEKHALSTLSDERENIEMQLDRLTDLLIQDRINQEIYDRKHTQLQQRHSNITVLLREQETEDRDKLEKALILLILLCNKSLYLFKNSQTQLNRLLLKTLFANFGLFGSNVRCAMVTPLSIILKKRESNEWQCLQSSANFSHIIDYVACHQCRGSFGRSSLKSEAEPRHRNHA